MDHRVTLHESLEPYQEMDVATSYYQRHQQKDCNESIPKG